MKKIVALILTLLMSVSLISCGVQQREEGVFLIWYYGLDNEMAEVQGFANKWAEDKGIKVKVVSANEGTAKELLDTDEKNRPDIYMGMRSEDTERLQMGKAVEAVPSGLISRDEYVSDDLYKATTFKNVQYGIPMTHETVALYYNKDMVDKVPETMEELLDMARNDGKKISFAATDYFFSFGFVFAFGGYTFKEDENGNFDSNDFGVNNEGALKGYKYIQDMIDHDKTFLGGASDMMTSGDFTRNITTFYIGEAGRVRTFKNSDMNFGVTKIPTADGHEVKPLKYVKMSCVSSSSPYKDLAWDFLNEFHKTSDEIYMNSNPYPPVFKKSLDSDSFKNNEHVQGLYEQSLSSTLMPNIKESGAINLVIPGYLTELCLGETTPEQCGFGIDRDFKLVIDKVLEFD